MTTNNYNIKAAADAISKHVEDTSEQMKEMSKKFHEYQMKLIDINASYFTELFKKKNNTTHK